jgi:hypothetical protein
MVCNTYQLSVSHAMRLLNKAMEQTQEQWNYHGGLTSKSTAMQAALGNRTHKRMQAADRAL